MYQLEVDYATQGPRTFFATVNNGTPIELDLNGSTFSDPQPIVMPVQLHAGVNTISFGNPNAGGFAPGLDSITVAPIVGVHSFNTVIPTSADVVGATSSFVFQVGGGMDLPLRKGIGIRLFEADYVRSTLPNAGNSTQNDLRLAADISFHFAN
jgi:hypothetical protein